MKVATWNVNSLTARWGRVEAWLTAKSPDVVLIQETKQNDVKFPTSGLAALGYESAHYGKDSGMALRFSPKWELRMSRWGLATMIRRLG